MSFNFPNNPVEDQVFIAVPGALAFIFKNGSWMRTSEDAPNDGKTYGRKNLSWQEVASTTYPDAPADGEIYARKDNAWAQVRATVISDTPPVGADHADLWWNSVNGNLYIRYNDGTSAQWVQINNIGT